MQPPHRFGASLREERPLIEGSARLRLLQLLSEPGHLHEMAETNLAAGHRLRALGHVGDVQADVDAIDDLRHRHVAVDAHELER